MESCPSPLPSKEDLQNTGIYYSFYPYDTTAEFKQSLVGQYVFTLNDNIVDARVSCLKIDLFNEDKLTLSVNVGNGTSPLPPLTIALIKFKIYVRIDSILSSILSEQLAAQQTRQQAAIPAAIQPHPSPLNTTGGKKSRRRKSYRRKSNRKKRRNSNRR